MYTVCAAVFCKIKILLWMFKAKSKGGIFHHITAVCMDKNFHVSAWPLLIGLAYSMFQVQVASISASGDFSLFVIAFTVSALAWIFNGKIEALLGLEYLDLLRSSKPVNRKIMREALHRRQTRCGCR